MQQNYLVVLIPVKTLLGKDGTAVVMNKSYLIVLKSADQNLLVAMTGMLEYSVTVRYAWTCRIAPTYSCP